ncbi:MAG: glutathione S-transferase family protein [Pseudomonadota bacterium]
MKIYGYMPGWSVPDISPYVSKLIVYCRMTGIDYEMVPQGVPDLPNAPRHKLPYIETEDGFLPDSNEIIAHLKRTVGDPLDGDATASELAAMHAWMRMIDEHTYWCGVIQPRWRKDAGWEVYKPIIMMSAAPISEPVLEVLDGFRDRIVTQFKNQGMGQKSDEEVFETFKTDVDALVTQLGDRPFFMGEAPRSIDAAVFTILTHTIEAPFDWKGRDYVSAQQSLKDYIDRMRGRFDLTWPHLSY